MKDTAMPSHHKHTKESYLALTLIGAGIGAGAWLVGHWRERELRRRWARQASRGLALQASRPLDHAPETNHHNGHQTSEIME